MCVCVFVGVGVNCAAVCVCDIFTHENSSQPPYDVRMMRAPITSLRRAKRVLYYGGIYSWIRSRIHPYTGITQFLTVSGFALSTFRKAVSIAIITARPSMVVYVVNLLKLQNILQAR